ncbi:MAG: hypothetical protein IPK13_20235 [Deltaproteobacteria bacterium]|nr:hypothetical protein [Deltaproteobacteria bacterium]
MNGSKTRPSLFGDEVYVACADVLGFKALINDRPLIEIVQAYDSFLGSEKASGHLDWALGTSDLPGWPRDQGTRHGAPIGHAVFSDTVFMWTWDLRPNSLRALLTTCTS